MKKIIGYYILFSLFTSTFINASPKETIYNVWPEIDINYKLSKKFNTSFSHQIRYDISNTSIKWFVYNIDCVYKINNHFKISSKYRYKDRIDAKQHGLYGNFFYQLDSKPINFDFRFRYNKKLRFSETENELIRKRDNDHIRSRILFEYKINKKIKPFTGTELFYLINDEKYGSGFDIYRLYLGIEFEIFKKQEIAINWIYEEVFNLGRKNIENIFNIEYSISIN